MPFDLALWNSPAPRRDVYESLGIAGSKHVVVTSKRRNPATGIRETKTKERATKRKCQSGQQAVSQGICLLIASMILDFDYAIPYTFFLFF